MELKETVSSYRMCLGHKLELDEIYDKLQLSDSIVKFRYKGKSQGYQLPLKHNPFPFTIRVRAKHDGSDVLVTIFRTGVVRLEITSTIQIEPAKIAKPILDQLLLGYVEPKLMSVCETWKKQTGRWSRQTIYKTHKSIAGYSTMRSEITNALSYKSGLLSLHIYEHYMTFTTKNYDDAVVEFRKLVKLLADIDLEPTPIEQNIVIEI